MRAIAKLRPAPGLDLIEVPVPTPGPVATPEPATLLLAGIGGMSACGWQFVRRRRPG